MTTYLSGSNIKGESMQTLYLMNPSFSGYNDSANSNMVLVSPNGGVTSQTSGLGSPHYAFSNTSPISHQSHTTTLSNLNGGHPNATSSEMLKAGIGGAQGYTWNGGNEFLFLPTSEMRDDNQSFAMHLNTLNAGQEQGFGVRKLPQASAYPEQVPFISTCVATGYNSTDNLQASTGSGQILSLSLSPQQSQLSQWQQGYPIQQSGLGVNNSSALSKQDNWIRASSNMVEMGLHNPLIAATNTGLVNALSNIPPKMELHSSKYLRSAQQLLNEVVGPGNVIKPKPPANLTKMQSWSSVSGSLNGGVLNQEKPLGDKAPKDESALVSWIEDKDALSAGIPSMSNNTTSVSEQTASEPVVELTIAQRQELQAKKDKLMAMLDEVDQRYKLYYHQMQMVVASFESAAGMGAARPYTAVALQTISRHFRCLKDAVRGQIRDVCKKLGEEPSGQLKGETSRLRFIDQQLRQQRALQQLGMMQQHPWRPQRGLPERSVSILRAWLFEHFLHPYPKDSDKVLLARQTGLTRNQVSNWFINARVRLWKPMVEEMYLEEMKESDTNDDSSNKATTSEGETAKKAHFGIDSAGNNGPNRASESGLLENEQQSNDMFQNRATPGSLQDSFLFHGKEAHETINRELENYSMPIQDDNQNGNNGSVFQFNQVPKYANEGLSSYGSNAGGVSLTLGLQHSEGLSLSRTNTHQAFMQDQGLQMVRQQQEDATNQTNYYAMHDISGGHSGSY